MSAIANRLTNIPQILTGLFVFGVISSSVVALANDPIIEEPSPLVIPTGTVEDLTGIEGKDAKDTSEWLAGVGGGEGETSTSDTIYEVEQSAYDSQAEAINLTLETKETTIGDSERITRRFPLTDYRKDSP